MILSQGEFGFEDMTVVKHVVVRAVGGIHWMSLFGRLQTCCTLLFHSGQVSSTMSSPVPEQPKSRCFNQFLYKAKQQNITILKIDV